MFSLQLSSLKDILLTVSAERVEEMQLAIWKVLACGGVASVLTFCAPPPHLPRVGGIQLYEHLTWNDPPKPFDAFHSVLFQLWTKRHVPKLHPPRS